MLQCKEQLHGEKNRTKTDMLCHFIDLKSEYICTHTKHILHVFYMYALFYRYYNIHTHPYNVYTYIIYVYVYTHI